MKLVPEFFCTNVRKVEPVGGDCVRIYCSIERNGAWEDRFMILAPISSVMQSARFLIESTSTIFNESHVVMEKETAH
jgi:hypothetical protein